MDSSNRTPSQRDFIKRMGCFTSFKERRSEDEGGELSFHNGTPRDLDCTELIGKL